MRYLSALSTQTIVNQLDHYVGPGRLRPVRAGERPEDFGGEQFGAIIADHAAQLPLLRLGLPVILLVPLHREGMRQFRILAEDGIDVRLWGSAATTLSETTLHSLSAPRAPSPAAVIVHHLRGRYSDLAADVVTTCATLATARRTMDDIAQVCNASPGTVRAALRDASLASVGGLVARMRALHALWAWESGRSNFWAAAGFRTLAELSSHLSVHTGAPLGRWRVPGGFASLLQSVSISLSGDTGDTVDTVEAAG